MKFTFDTNYTEEELLMVQTGCRIEVECNVEEVLEEIKGLTI